jgi:hypothetical protein
MKTGIFLAFFFAIPVHAQVVKCSDANGKITYSGTPCQANERAMLIKGEVQVLPHSTQTAPAAATSASGATSSRAIETTQRDMRSLSILRPGPLDQTLPKQW